MVCFCCAILSLTLIFIPGDWNDWHFMRQLDYEEKSCEVVDIEIVRVWVWMNWGDVTWLSYIIYYLRIADPPMIAQIRTHREDLVSYENKICLYLSDDDEQHCKTNWTSSFHRGGEKTISPGLWVCVKYRKPLYKFSLMRSRC